jgi:hypothetical protein
MTLFETLSWETLADKDPGFPALFSVCHSYLPMSCSTTSCLLLRGRRLSARSNMSRTASDFVLMYLSYHSGRS